MEILQITENKKRFLKLLLVGDEQESMIDRYLERGEMFVLYDDGLKALCVVTDEGDGVCELKNIAVVPEAHRRGYGRRLIDYICGYCRGKYRTLLAGTGETPASLGFYKGCGFVFSHRIPGFFTEHYDHPIWEEGVLLTDMVYLKKEIK